jgi:tetratricopeptide (TPR) repeat protein
MQEDNQVEALRAFKRAVEVEPDHVDANLNIAFISIRFRDYTTAEKSLSIAMAAPRVQRDLEAQIAMGVAQRGLKRYADAEATYNTAIALDAGDPRPWWNLGVLYQEHKVSEDDVDQIKTEELYRTAQSHFNKFCTVAAGKACKDVNTKSLAKSARRGRNLDEDKKIIADAKLRVIIIDEAFAAFRQMEELEKKMKELAKIEEAQAKEERTRLLELERLAREAEEAGDEEEESADGDAAE